MTTPEDNYLHLPDYESFVESIASLNVQISASQLHGLICGYLCAGADKQGEAYIRALLQSKKSSESRDPLLALFSLFTISQQQLNAYDLGFNLLLPNDDNPLSLRAKAFSQWCEGFSTGLNLAGIDRKRLNDTEAQEALFHFGEFAKLDYEAIDIAEEDEYALMEVIEYARMAVIRLHSDLMRHQQKKGTRH